MYSPTRGARLPHSCSLKAQSPPPQRVAHPFQVPSPWHAQSPNGVSSSLKLGALSPPVTTILAPAPALAPTPTASMLPPPRTAPALRHSIGHGQGHVHGKADCQDQQCIEEECDPEECGDERSGPKAENRVCGIDRRPFLPFTLALSTVGGATQMALVQFRLLPDAIPGARVVKACFLALYALTLGCMAYCAFGNPGEFRKSSAMLLSTDDSSKEEVPIPRRAHRTWLYKLPVRRYDHYCRWLMNCIGLLNHREFVIMVGGLVTIGLCGCALDIGLAFYLVREGPAWLTSLLLAVHIAYSAMVTALASPILRLHIGFICRNELASEWKRNDFYVVAGRGGKKVSVNDLSDDEFNERFESFEYDKSKNVYDKSGPMNCFIFWCTSRWDPKQLGEF